MKIRNRIRDKVLLACLSLICGFACAPDKTIKLELSTFAPSTDRLTIMLQEWCDEVGKRTNGRVRVNLHPGATLTTPSQTYDSVVKEIIDIGFGPMGATTGRFPFMEVMDLPLGLKSGYKASMLSMELFKTFRPEELSDVKVLFMLSSPPAYLQTRNPIRNLEELKGTKLRAVGGTTTRVTAALGAVPLALGPTDVYDALSKGVADGAIVISDALAQLKWGEFLKYTTLNTRTSYVNSGYFVMNLNKWKSLPSYVQEIIDDMSEEYLEKMSQLWDEKEKDAITTLKSEGHTTFTLSPEEEERWVERVVPVYDEYVREKSAKGIPAADVLEFCRNWVKKNQ
ncbi:MAG: TRAP transporter substrate-binding protein [Deltaproteobacteria bacterium]|nr:TRAP transporter substrate-binding protein [Deltaproteobacteria bacterium]